MTPGTADLVATAAGRGLILDLVDPERDPRARQRCRTYRLHLQDGLWGGVSVVRQWGRRGQLHRPRSLVTHHADVSEARAELERVILRRLRRGYWPAQPS